MKQVKAGTGRKELQCFANGVWAVNIFALYYCPTANHDGSLCTNHPPTS
jgi:hypothetical protein